MPETVRLIVGALAAALTLGLAGAAMADEADIDAACQALGAEYGRIITLGSGETANFCQFEDNRGCTLEAQQAGLCPENGRKITGYYTEAARYCAWLGGEVAMTEANDPTLDELDGTCALPDGSVCVIGRLYYGSCD